VFFIVSSFWLIGVLELHWRPFPSLPLPPPLLRLCLDFFQLLPRLPFGDVTPVLAGCLPQLAGGGLGFLFLARRTISAFKTAAMLGMGEVFLMVDAWGTWAL
jgi:hypothetical protein